MENIESPERSESIEQYEHDAPWVGGIRLDIERIKEKHNGKLITTGKSGKSISIQVEPDNIYIELIEESDIHFGAKLQKDKEGKNLIELDVRTKGQDLPERAWDFHAQELAGATINYFKKNNEIHGIKVNWLDYSDEYKKYFALKKDFLGKLSKTETDPNLIEVEAKKRAALGTWTGTKVALPNGFDDVYVEETEIIKELPDSEYIPIVVVCFMKKSLHPPII